MTKPEKIDISPQELEALLERVESGSLAPGDFELIKAMAETISFLSSAVDKKGAQLARMLRALFGSKSEKAEAVLGDDTDRAGEKKETGEEEKKKRRGGNGRRAASEYTNAETVVVPHSSHKPGDSCPKCEDGVLYEQKEPSRIVRVRAETPIKATIYELQRLRCGLCGETFTAERPEGVGEAKYDESVVALIALLKYGMGLPLYRLDKLQAALGVPLASSTQWDILEKNIERYRPVVDELCREAALGDVVHNDDTSVKVLDLMGKRREKNPPDDSKRTGMYTTGIVSRRGERTIALYFSGSRHAGENLDRLLALRPHGTKPPVQMCDGLSHNAPAEAETLLGNCLVHGRRRFVEVIENFPDEVRHVIEELGKVYEVDERAREEKLSDRDRLRLHRRESGPRMKKLKRWLDALVEEKKVEPNSSLGDAIEYVTKRWDELTLFLREPGAPLDNNIVERALKRAILHRKNSLFYKSQKGAEVGDSFMSLIHSTELAGENPFEYLHAIALHATRASEAPSEWMPWNFREALERAGEAATVRAD